MYVTHTILPPIYSSNPCIRLSIPPISSIYFPHTPSHLHQISITQQINYTPCNNKLPSTDFFFLSFSNHWPQNLPAGDQQALRTVIHTNRVCLETQHGSMRSFHRLKTGQNTAQLRFKAKPRGQDNPPVSKCTTSRWFTLGTSGTSNHKANWSVHFILYRITHVSTHSRRPRNPIMTAYFSRLQSVATSQKKIPDV